MAKLNEKKENARKVPKTQEQEALLQNAADILKNLKARTWRDLETRGKFLKKR